MLKTSLEISIQGIQVLSDKYQWNFNINLGFPKKCRLGPQNGSGSSGLEKLLKIVNFVIIKETAKLKEKMVGPRVE